MDTHPFTTLPALSPTASPRASRPVDPSPPAPLHTPSLTSSTAALPGSRPLAPPPQRPPFFPSSVKSDDLLRLVPIETLANWFYPSFPMELPDVPHLEGPPRWYAAFEPWHASICPVFWQLLEAEDRHSIAVPATFGAYLDETADETSERTLKARKAVQKDLNKLGNEMLAIWTASYGLHGLRKRFLDYYKEADRIGVQWEEEWKKSQDGRAGRVGRDEAAPDEGGVYVLEKHRYRIRSEEEIVEEEAHRFTFDVPPPSLPGLKVWPSYLSHPSHPCLPLSSTRTCTTILPTTPTALLVDRRVPVIRWCESFRPVPLPSVPSSSSPSVAPPELASISKASQSRP